MCRKLDPSLSSHRFRAAPSIWADWAAGGWAEAGRKGWRRHRRQGATRKPRKQTKKRKLFFSKAKRIAKIRFLKSIVKFGLTIFFSSDKISQAKTVFLLIPLPFFALPKVARRNGKGFAKKLLKDNNQQKSGGRINRARSWWSPSSPAWTRSACPSS